MRSILLAAFGGNYPLGLSDRWIERITKKARDPNQIAGLRFVWLETGATVSGTRRRPRVSAQQPLEKTTCLLPEREELTLQLEQRQQRLA